MQIQLQKKNSCADVLSSSCLLFIARSLYFYVYFLVRYNQ